MNNSRGSRQTVQNPTADISNPRDSAQSGKVNFLTFEDPSCGYSITYPPNWRPEKAERACRVIFFPPAPQGYIEQLNVFVRVFNADKGTPFPSAKTPLDRIAGGLINNYKQGLKNFELIGSEPFTKGGGTLPLYKIAYKFFNTLGFEAQGTVHHSK